MTKISSIIRALNTVRELTGSDSVSASISNDDSSFAGIISAGGRSFHFNTDGEVGCWCTFRFKRPEKKWVCIHCGADRDGEDGEDVRHARLFGD